MMISWYLLKSKPLYKYQIVSGFLFTLTTDAAGKLDVLGHDGDTLGVDGTQVGVLEE